MEFNQKLQNLRKHKGLTQEELAELLCVSRTAISKWESGRGYPNIDSLKTIAKLFTVTIDELLSSDELLIIAEVTNKQKEKYLRDLIFGLLDLSVAMFLFLPFFGQNVGATIQGVSLLSLTAISTWLRISYLVIIVGMISWGILTLALQNCNQKFWVRHKSKVSLLLNIIATLLFIISSQPYAAAYLFVFLVIKALIFIKWQ